MRGERIPSATTPAAPVAPLRDTGIWLEEDSSIQSSLFIGQNLNHSTRMMGGAKNLGIFSKLLVLQVREKRDWGQTF